MKHTIDIPQWSYINFQVLYQIQKMQEKGTLEKVQLSDVIDKTTYHIGCKPPLKDFWTPINAGSIFSFLYSAIVVPKELFAKSDNDFFNQIRIDEFQLFNEIIKGEEKLTSSYEIMRFLRNSISHVNYETYNDFDVLMWNFNYQKEKDIEVKTDIHKLANFGVYISKIYSKKGAN